MPQTGDLCAALTAEPHQTEVKFFLWELFIMLDDEDAIVYSYRYDSKGRYYFMVENKGLSKWEVDVIIKLGESVVAYYTYVSTEEA